MLILFEVENIFYSLWVFTNNTGWLRRKDYQFHFTKDILMMFFCMFKTSKDADKFLNTIHKNTNLIIEKSKFKNYIFIYAYNQNV